ncbi:aldo/keto reductase [Spirilliplanes yamanashiensis]|nr:aldo/keto reductase [Spirilliplanes yamanashiensis]MDP9814429.1 aryl-alcohol dehydrogenase-like predicted oxidoreductase [Spirilliplanes yamanashiensis]
MSEIVLGAMLFGTRLTEQESFAVLDRFVERGGTWIDTANCYSYWLDPAGQDGQSEEVLGRWLKARPGLRDRVRIATKAGHGQVNGQPEGLSAAAVRSAAEQSLRRLGVEHIDLYWTHVEDRSVPLEETVGALGELHAAGVVGRLGVSNHPAWRVAQARDTARRLGVEPYTALQLRHSYLQPRVGAAIPETAHRFAWPETLDYVRTEPGLDLWAYTPLMNGAYVRDDRLADAFDHPGTARKRAALSEVARDLGVNANQVVLAWLLGGDPAAWPIVGASRLEWIDEAMDAAELKLDAEAWRRLDVQL